MRYHLVGVGGEGMAGLALLAQALDHKVQGSQLVPTAGLSEVLDAGIPVFRQHHLCNVMGVDCVVRSSGISMDHVEIKAAESLGARVVKRSYALGELLQQTGCEVVAIAGSHGKTTMTAMLTDVLMMAQHEPVAVVGARPLAWQNRIQFGSGSLAVVEACEYDRSFLDLAGKWPVVSSIGADHLDYYRGGVEEVAEAFRTFVDRSLQQGSGSLLVCADNELAMCTLADFSDRSISYGLEAGDWQAQLTELTRGCCSFLVRRRGKPFGHFRLSLPGIHNVQNALGVIALADELGVSRADIGEALVKYAGVTRRYEKICERDRVVLIEDYGHVPEQIAITVATARQEFPTSRIVCVACLRQFHRTRDRLEEFAEALSRADDCLIGPVVPGLGDGLTTDDPTLLADLASRVREAGIPAQPCAEYGLISVKVCEGLRQPHAHTVVIVIGSGETCRAVGLIREGILKL